MINFLEQVLSDNSLYQSILDSENPKQFITDNFDVDTDKLFNPIPDINPLKKWEIFSRVRFEYVRPTCTKRTATARVLPLMSEEDKEYGLKAYFLAGLTVSDEVKQAVESLDKYPEKSLGKALHTYYKINQIPSPKEASLFPPEYILLHDIHHVLLNSPVTEEGELEVICFESGMIQKTEFPILLVEQLDILLQGKNVNLCNTATLLKAWNLGVNSVSTLDSFYLDYLAYPITEVRQSFNLVPLR